MAPKRRCHAITKGGKACRARPLTGRDHCLAHSDAITRGSVGFTPEAGKLGGRPRLPAPHELMREKIEADLELVLAPYFDALASEDEERRMRAADRLLDRVYGKPAQALEHTGPGGAPISAEIVTADAKEVADAAHDFLARLAGTDA